MKIVLFVKSSSLPDIYYEVAFSNRNEIISIKCNCPAGELTKLCKHKLALLRGDSSILTDFNNDNDCCQVNDWIRNSLFSQLINEHDTIEKDFNEKQIALRKIKNKIEDAMRRGI